MATRDEEAVLIFVLIVPVCVFVLAFMTAAIDELAVLTVPPTTEAIDDEATLKLLLTVVI